MEGGVTYSGSAAVNSLQGVNEQTANLIANRKLEMVLRASMNVRAWIMSRLALG